MNRLVLNLSFLFTLTSFGVSGYSNFLPNNFELQEPLEDGSNIDEETFNSIIDKALQHYEPIIREHGAKLVINRLWTTDTVNASAMQNGKTWFVNMYGGLARRPEVTPDGFALVLCHELGHHLGGFPFARSWAANEGQSDYFATLSCARDLWQNELTENRKAATLVAASAKEICNENWQTPKQRYLCYRIMTAGKSLAALLARGKGGGFHSPDPTEVEKTNHRHPQSQCRLDTMMAGALCDSEFGDAIIPKSETVSISHTCTRHEDYEIGTRPLCWFKPDL